MEEPDLQREPNPQPEPRSATGAIPKPVRIKIATAAVLVGLVVMGSCFFLSRKSTTTPTRQRPIQTLTEPGGNPFNTAKDRAAEESYRKAQHDLEELKRQIEMQRLNGGQSNPPTQEPPPPAAPYQPIVQTVAVAPQSSPKQDYEKLLHDAAFSDNMVEIKGGMRGDRYRNNGNGRDDGAGTVGVSAQSEHRDGSDLREARPEAKSLTSSVLPEGTVIECTLVNQLVGDNSGPVQAQVSNDVVLPGTLTVVIPQGSKFLGDSKQVSVQNQQRLAVAFHRLQVGTQSGHIRVYSLDQMPGLDQTGAMALKDQVNNHYLQIFGASMAIGAIGGLAQIGNGGYGGINGYDASVEFRNGVTQNMAQSSAQILNRFLNRLPTITIRPGTRIAVYLTKDLELPPYEVQ